VDASTVVDRMTVVLLDKNVVCFCWENANYGVPYLLALHLLVV